MSAFNTIKFRAKRLDNNQWIEGSYIHFGLMANSMVAEHTIAQKGCYPVAVDRKTIGQWREDIGAYDGDWVIGETNVIPVTKVEGFVDFQDLTCVIEQPNDESFPVCSFGIINPLNLVVTKKNIFDNPELLEASTN